MGSPSSAPDPGREPRRRRVPWMQLAARGLLGLRWAATRLCTQDIEKTSLVVVPAPFLDDFGSLARPRSRPLAICMPDLVYAALKGNSAALEPLISLISRGAEPGTGFLLPPRQISFPTSSLVSRRLAEHSRLEDYSWPTAGGGYLPQHGSTTIKRQPLHDL